MSELVLRPASPIPRAKRFEANTDLVRRRMLVGVASRRPDDVAVMVSRARARGVSYRRIAEWLGPRTSCPAQLLALRERVELFASIERS